MRSINVAGGVGVNVAGGGAGGNGDDGVIVAGAVAFSDTSPTGCEFTDSLVTGSSGDSSAVDARAT